MTREFPDNEEFGQVECAQLNSNDYNSNKKEVGYNVPPLFINVLT